jgi:hypothetical protein
VRSPAPERPSAHRRPTTDDRRPPPHSVTRSDDSDNGHSGDLILMVADRSPAARSFLADFLRLCTGRRKRVDDLSRSPSRGFSFSLLDPQSHRSVHPHPSRPLVSASSPLNFNLFPGASVLSFCVARRTPGLRAGGQFPFNTPSLRHLSYPFLSQLLPADVSLSPS